MKKPHGRYILQKIKRKKIFQRDNYTCQYCGYNPDTLSVSRDLTIDHIYPIIEGGSFIDNNNLITACKLCNSLANAKAFNSFKDKKDYIQARLRSRGELIFDTVT